MDTIKFVINYLKTNQLILATAESCTAGKIITKFSQVTGCGDVLDTGFVTYSVEAKKKLLKVKARTIKKFTLTSEEVAKEMAVGALQYSQANVAIACTGIAGDKPIEGIDAGTVCFAWGFQIHHKIHLFSETQYFSGTRAQIQNTAAKFAIFNLIKYHKSYVEG